MVRSRDGQRRTRRAAAALIGMALIAASCSDKKDDEAVGEEAAVEATDAGAAVTDAVAAAAAAAGTATTSGADTTDADTATTSDDTAAETTTGDTEESTDTTAGEDEEPIAVQSTLPPPEGEPVMGGRLVVAGEAEVGAPWTPANVQCDSYCQVRIRTFIEPLAVVDTDLEVTGWLAESIEPNENSTEFTITLREGITFSDGTPLTAEAVIDNLSRNGSSLLLAGALRDLAKNPDGSVMAEITNDLAFTLFTGKNGDVNEPVEWYAFPYYLTSQPGFVASPTWLAAVDADANLSTQPVGTGPFIVQSYLPGDRMTVTRNPEYWRTDPAGNQLPYLDEIEFRVIADSQVRGEALESGDVDLVSTADAGVVSSFVDNEDFVMVQQNVRTETAYTMLHLTQPQFQDREVRCALVQAVDKQALVDAIYAGFPPIANGPFSPGQDGYLEDTGLPQYDPDAARAAIEAWEAENGPLEITYSTTPTGSTRAVADFLQQALSEVGVDVTIATAEQSQFIVQALLGDPTFFAFGWRNHGGITVDTQNSWWHGFGANAAGDQVADGQPNLNFGRLNDPVINDLLDQARETADLDERALLAQDINRQFGQECWILPAYHTIWGIIMDPAVQNVTQESTPDGGIAIDGQGFPGQVWLDSVWIEG